MVAIVKLTGNETVAALLGNAVFVIVSGICIWRSRKLSVSSVTSVFGAVVGFIAAGIILADLGGLLYSSVPAVGYILINAFSIGYYPPGADAPFGMGAMLWAFSMLGLCAAALALGGLLKSVRPPPEE